MITFKQFMEAEDQEREIYAKIIEGAPPFSPELAEDDYKIGDVTFSAKDGLGSVPFNQSVYYHGFVALVKPSKFLDLALEDDDDKKRVWNMVKLAWKGYAFGIPFLQMDISGLDAGEGGHAKIKGHEGRGRMQAFMEIEGDTPVPIHIFLTGGDRNRHLTRDIMSMINEGVFGQRGNYIIRPFIKTWVKPDEGGQLPSQK